MQEFASGKVDRRPRRVKPVCDRPDPDRSGQTCQRTLPCPIHQPAQRQLANVMTEAELQSLIIALAHVHSWRVAHFRPARTERGWRTAVAADGAGFFDLVMVRQDGRGDVICIELKTEKGRLSHEQEMWHILFLNRKGIGVYIWRPSDWLSGRIEQVLE